VRDQGIGIAPQVLPHIFELFVQADESLARSRGGMGIGLTLVKRLVELHGGRVVAKSDGLGRGTEFVLNLPLTSRRTEPVVALPGMKTAPTQRCSILLIEDNHDAADSLSAFLVESGHEVTLANDGIAGLHKATGGTYDVAIIDIGLPGMDGYEIAERIRSEARHPTVLIALTGYGGSEQRRRAHGAGIHRHLVKPVDPDLLLQVVSQACQDRRSDQPAGSFTTASQKPSMA
jgi:CheY-like chemotaxis protein